MGITAMKTAVEHSTFCRNDMHYTEGHFWVVELAIEMFNLSSSLLEISPIAEIHKPQLSLVSLLFAIELDEENHFIVWHGVNHFGDLLILNHDLMEFSG